MRWWAVGISLLTHGAIIGTVWLARQSVEVTPTPMIDAPIQFELVEEAHDATAAEPIADLAPEKPIETMAPIVETPMVPNAVAEPEAAADEERAKVVSAPQALNRIVPNYPRSARRHHREGVVEVEFKIDSSGKVNTAKVIVSSGFAELDEAALKAVRGATFAPASEDGVSIAATMRLTFDFRLL